MNKRLAILAALLAASVLLFLFCPLGDWRFNLPQRAQTLPVMLLVGTAIGLATIVFQTLTTNRLLTPSIIGLDALYLLLQMAVIFLLGATAYLKTPPLWKYYTDTALLMLAAALLFGLFLPLLARDIYRLLLVGIIFGVLCSKLTELMGRMLDPTDYTYYQGVAYAQFNRAKPVLLLLPASGFILAAAGYLWHKRYALDIIALGREHAINLGVPYHRDLFCLMLAVSLLTATATALAGPVVFFGLLVSALTYRLIPSPHHAVTLPAAALLAAIILVLGQTVFERVFNLGGTLSVVIEGLGGLVFLYLLLAGKRP